MVKICVIVPVRNNLELTKTFFKSFVKTNFFDKEEIHLLFIDDGSEDGTHEWLLSIAEKNDWVDIKRNDKSLGVCSSWNIGLSWAKDNSADFIAILNNDIEFYSNGCLRSMMNVLTSDDLVFWTSPETCYDQKRKAGKKGRIHFEQLLYSQSKTSYIVGCCFMIPRKSLDEIGMFDERFVIRYYEDLDYINRILEAGFKVKMASNNLVFHNRGSTSLKVSGGETNYIFYDEKWKSSPYNILEMQPKEKKGAKYFNFNKIW